MRFTTAILALLFAVPGIAQILFPILGGKSIPGAPSAPMITSTSPLPGGTQTVPYSYPFTATGTNPINWTATGVPAGMMLSLSGQLTGTPTTVATSTIQVTAMNGIGTTGPLGFSITISPPVGPVITSTSPLPVSQVNTAYSAFQFTATGTAPFTWIATGVPAGMMLSSAGVLSGTPTTAGTSSLSVTVMNAGGTAGPMAFSLTINGPTTFTAASCNQSDVNAVINGPTHTAADGDTINIPAGTCTWTAGITVPAGIGISIIGAGAENTTIIDNFVSGVLGNNLFYFSPNFGASLSRVSSITLSPQTGLIANSLMAPLAFQGSCSAGVPGACPNIRVDNISFPSPPDWSLLTQPSNTLIVVDSVFGVLDHNTVTMGSRPIGGYFEFVNFNMSGFPVAGQPNGLYGDNSWFAPTNFGSNQAIYVESNTFTQGTGGNTTFPITETEGQPGGLSQGGGGRIVCRFNLFQGVRSPCVNHGTESPGRRRGGRSMEFYKNTLTCNNTTFPCFANLMSQGAGVRSGSVLSLENTWTWVAGTGLNTFTGLQVYRYSWNFPPWGICDGTSSYDLNDPMVYFNGTIMSATPSDTTGPFTIVVSGSPGWTPGQWAPTGANAGQPFSFHDFNLNNGAEIVNNDANSFTTKTTFNKITWGVGDSIQIGRAFQCIDQSSRNGGSLMSGATPAPTNTTGLVYQTLDPVYEAADTNNNGVALRLTNPVVSGTARQIANRDFYSEVSQSAQTSPTSPFNGTVGTGYGTLANRPITCTPSVGYWATDQGSWNTSGSGGQGQLFVCTATNTWTLYFTPYAYPHPLIQ